MIYLQEEVLFLFLFLGAIAAKEEGLSSALRLAREAKRSGEEEEVIIGRENNRGCVVEKEANPSGFKGERRRRSLFRFL